MVDRRNEADKNFWEGNKRGPDTWGERIMGFDHHTSIDEKEIYKHEEGTFSELESRFDSRNYKSKNNELIYVGDSDSEYQ